jgi:hypothetical protein
MKDPLHMFFEAARYWTSTLSGETMSSLARLTMLFILPAGICFGAFSAGSRSTFIQSICCVIGILLAISLPLPMPGNATIRVWTLVLDAVLLGFLPLLVPRFLTPHLGVQRKLSWFLYGLLFVLLVLALTMKGCSPC